MDEDAYQILRACPRQDLCDIVGGIFLANPQIHQGCHH